MKIYIKVFFIFFILGMAVYSNSFHNQFMMDDYTFIQDPMLSQTQYMFSQWNPFHSQALGILDGQEHLNYYRPLTHMLYNFYYVSFKTDYWKYHLLNLLLLALAATLIYVFMDMLRAHRAVAVLSGVFYLIHPINGVMVDYISATVFSLQVIFMLLALLLLMAALEAGHNRWLYAFSLLFCFLSLFWHESAVMTPLYVAAYVLLLRDGPLRKKCMLLSPYILIMMAYLVFRMSFLGVNEAVSENLKLYHLSAGQYLASIFKADAWYLGRLFCPKGIVLLWASPVVRHQVVLGALELWLLLSIFIALYVHFRKQPIILLGLVWFGLGFIPVSAAVFRYPQNGLTVEPHWFDFALIGFFIVLAHIMTNVITRLRLMGWAMLVFILAAWGSISYANNFFWSDEMTYARYWSAQDPDFRLPYIYMAMASERRGDTNQALFYFKYAMAEYPAGASAYCHMAALELNLGNYQQAKADCVKALKINPNSAAAYTNLGSVYQAQGQWAKAQESYHRSLELNPYLASSRIGLASLAARQKNFKLAIKFCRQNLDFLPDDYQTLNYLLDLYAYQGDQIDTAFYADRLIKVLDNPRELTKLGIKMAKAQYNNIAMSFFSRAIAGWPNDPNAYLAAGTLLANQGQYNQAIKIWQIGLSLDPHNQNFTQNISKASKFQ